MRHSLLFAIPLVVLLASCAQRPAATVPIQQPPAQPASASTPQPATTSTAVPRQTAELRADILMARKEYKEAIRAYDEILKDAPNDAELLNKIGVAYQQMIDLNRAEHYYKRAVKADKKFASAINNVGTVEYEKKHWGKAIGYYKKALEIRTDMASIYVNLGYAYIEDKKYPEAMDAFGKALQVDATVFENKGGNGAVVQQRNTSDPGLLDFFIAKTYALAGDAERTAHYLKRARDGGYKDMASVPKDPAFAKVIKDPRVQEVLTVPPSYETEGRKSTSN
jgi:tetratricopeptide (TPR) repeat protein